MLWNNPPADTTPYFGFVYMITCNINRKKYIGKKQFLSLKTLPPLAGFKRKRKVYSDSGWRTYTSSSKWVNEDIQKYGIEQFTFTILYLCKTRGELSYLEARTQWEHLVMENPDLYYNRQIAGIKWIYRGGQ